MMLDPEVEELEIILRVKMKYGTHSTTSMRTMEELEDEISTYLVDEVDLL